RPVAQHLGERISERPWLNQLDHVSIGHGVSLLCWRSGGSNTPTIRRLLPVRPSPTSAHSSLDGAVAWVAHQFATSDISSAYAGCATGGRTIAVTAARITFLITMGESP